MGKKLTTEEFITKAKAVHGDKFDYSLVEYVNGKSTIKLICPKHGVFDKLADKHLSGQGCQKCATIRNALSQDIVIKQFQTVHTGSKFDYSLVSYTYDNTKVKIICNTCNKMFEQTPSAHKQGQGCPYCIGKHLTLDGVVNRFIKIHGNKFDYSEVKYVKNSQKVKIICNTCNKHFLTSPSNHYKYGCPHCVNRYRTPEEFVNQCIEIHDNKYNYSETEYVNAKHKVKVYCNTCNDYFYIRPSHHLNNVGCASCAGSKGEHTIKNILQDLNFKYVQEKRFNDCVYKRPLPFDFYIPSLNVCIEYDGQHHFKCVEFFGESHYNDTQIRDDIKTQYCVDNNIQLIRIPYWEFNNIEEILKRELN